MLKAGFSDVDVSGILYPEHSTQLKALIKLYISVSKAQLRKLVYFT